MKPGLSLEERKKALNKLKSETKCNDCGQQGHWKGDPGCMKQKKTGFLATSLMESQPQQGKPEWNRISGPLLEAEVDDGDTCGYMMVDSEYDVVGTPGAQSSAAAPARPELFDLALHEDDKVFKYGDHKGKSYAQVVTDHPEYLVDVKKMTTHKSCPKYITEFIEWTACASMNKKGSPGEKGASLY